MVGFTGGMTGCDTAMDGVTAAAAETPGAARAKASASGCFIAGGSGVVMGWIAGICVCSAAAGRSAALAPTPLLLALLFAIGIGARGSGGISGVGAACCTGGVITGNGTPVVSRGAGGARPSGAGGGAPLGFAVTAAGGAFWRGRTIERAGSACGLP